MPKQTQPNTSTQAIRKRHTSQTQRWRRKRWQVGATITGLTILGLTISLITNGISSVLAVSSQGQPTAPASAGADDFSIAAPPWAVPAAAFTRARLASQPPPNPWHEVVIESGDTLSDYFSRFSIYSALPKLTQLEGAEAWLTRLKPGHVLRFKLQDQQLQSLVIQRNALQQAHFVREGEQFRFFVTERQVERRWAQAQGSIDGSLFHAGHEAGLADRLIVQLTNIFRWDIDFHRDLRKGDRFAILYEDLYLDDQPYAQGDILAAEIQRGKRVLRAVRFVPDNGAARYYSPDGRSMRRPFLRTPVEFTRISSRFSRARKHPILGYTRAHKGVDYAAPTGTPIKATAAGKVRFAGRKGGYGNAIVLAHRNSYSTLYGHLSRIAPGIRAGAPVNQGEIIGYVGSTGLSTGPHLHYELRVNGVHKNPLTIDLPGSPPLPKHQLAAFREATAPLIARLDQLSGDLQTAELRQP